MSFPFYADTVNSLNLNASGVGASLALLNGADSMNMSTTSLKFLNGDSNTTVGLTSINVSGAGANLELKDGVETMTASTTSITFAGTGSDTVIGLNAINVSGTNVSLTLTDSTSQLVLSGKSVELGAATQIKLNGSAGNTGDLLTSAGPDAVPTWTTITAFFNIETGTYTNASSLTGINISFSKSYSEAPTVFVTANSDGSGNIVAVALDGVTASNARVLFASSTLKSLNYVIFPNSPPMSDGNASNYFTAL
jgi:hypothetical protein